MSFADPTHLLALLALPLLAIAWAIGSRRRRRFAVRHPGVVAAAGLSRRSRRWRRIVPIALLAASTISLSAAFAKPERTVDVPVEKASVVLVADQSGSMNATDVQPSRIEAAREAARSFLDDAPEELLIGFTGFSSSVSANVAPTTDRGDVRDAIDAVQAEGGTATGDALNAALDQLATRKGSDGKTAPAAIVLLSDGATTDGANPTEAAARAKQLGIPVFTVALGTAEGSVTLPDGRIIEVPPDPATLQQIAQGSGGQAYSVADADTLGEVYKNLGSKIGTRKETREATGGFLASGLVLLLGGLGTGVRFRSRFV